MAGRWPCFCLLLFTLLPIAADSGDRRFGDAANFDDYVNRGARILVVGAHPDDESPAGPLLEYACKQRGNACHIAVFTSGGAGTCGMLPAYCQPGLAAVRTREMQRVAKRYGAGLDVGYFYDHPASGPPESETVEGYRTVWEKQGDPRTWLKDIVQRFRPDLLITFDPDHGFTGNPEHQLASLIVEEVLNPESGVSPDGTHPAVFHILNRYQFLKIPLGNDPAAPTEQWPMHRSCGEQSCVQTAMKIATEHRSQLAVSALALFVLFADQFDVLYLRKLAWPPGEKP
jgi:LmbE family N-acetylglucosaminyl deacetylase